jgi:hypothetical protein
MFGPRAKAHPGQIASPKEIIGDEKAREVLTVWLRSDGSNTTIIKPDTWDDAAAWGLLLADVARHIANAMVVKGGSHDEILARVRLGFEVELGDPTDQPTGRWED